MGLFIDVSKAFDSIKHNILIKNLEEIGMEGMDLEWFRNYLTGRRQFVFVNGVESDLQNVVTGVPQGSVLGPILFIVYINSIKDLHLNGTPFGFADDTSLFYTGDNSADVLHGMENDLKTISNCLDSLQLNLNLKKTVYMTFAGGGGVQCQTRLQFENCEIKKVACTKFLGLMLDERLIWREHIEMIVRKIQPVIRTFARIRNYLPSELKRKVYFALVHSHFCFLANVWGHCAERGVKRLEILQKRALKILFKLDYRMPSTDLYSTLNIPSVGNVIKTQSVLYLVKIRKELLESDIQLATSADTHGYNIRIKEILRLPNRLNTSMYGTGGVLSKAISLYNQIPNNIISLELYALKRELKKMFI